MNTSYDHFLVALSIGVAIVASYVTLDLAARLCASRQSSTARFWLVGGAASMGAGIWSMHFIGMMALQMPIAMSYDLKVTLLSLLIACLVSGLALYTINREVLTTRRLLAAGVAMGAGIAAMHYSGMAAMEVQPAIGYDLRLVVLSVVIAIAAAVVALWIAFRLRLENNQYSRWTKVVSATVMGTAIVGMHYVGMAAASFAPNSICTVNSQGVNQVWLGGAIALLSLIVLVITLLVSLFDARLEQGAVALLESERRFKSAFDFAAIGMALVGKDGRWIQVNRSICEFLGYSEDELLARTFQDVTYSDDLASDLELVQQILSGSIQNYQLEKRYLDKQGKIVWGLLSVSLVRDQTGAPLYFISQIQDITARKRAERAIFESEERFQLVVQGTNDGIWDLDVASGECYYSPRYRQLLGCTMKDLPGTREAFESRLHPDDLPRIQAALAAHYDNFLPYDVEYRLRSQAGDYIWFQARGQASRDGEGQPLRFVGALRDISDRKQSEQTLERGRRFLNDIIDAIPQPLFVKSRELRFLMLNQAFCGVLGQSREQLIGKRDHDVMPQHNADVYVARDRRVFEERREDTNEEEIVDATGDRRTIVTRKTLFQDLEGNDVLVGLINDITDLKRAQEALRKSEENHRLLAEHSSDLILRIGPDGTMTYVSPASFSVLGYEPEDLIGRAASKFIHSEDLKGVTQLFTDVVRRDAQQVVTCRVRSRSGPWVWCETSVRSVRDEASGLALEVIAVCRNVDERVKVAAALATAHDDLERHHAIEEEEKRVAKHVLDRLVRSNQALADRVETWILPARYFSGDVVAVTETPGKVLHLLLADGTGHGLSAALGALPALQPFYAMSHKGFSIGAIVREMNNKIRELLPPGRFIAATMASIDPAAGVIQVWNGGNPSSLLLDDEGNLVRDFPSIHLALGILRDKDFNAHVETASFDSANQLMMFSDGLVDAINQQKERFGEERLLRLCADARPSARLVYLRSVLHGHLEYEPPEDDISVVIARCERIQSVGVQPSTRSVVDVARQASDYGLHFVLSAEQLKSADVVPALCTLFKELHLVGPEDTQVFVVLSELFNNALDHGLLELPSTLKDQREDPEVYLNERALRLAHLTAGYIHIQARSVGEGSQRSLKLTIRDTGEGFDFKSRLAGAVATSAQRHGRGISLVSALCTTVEYRDGGREVEVLLPLAA